MSKCFDTFEESLKNGVFREAVCPSGKSAESLTGKKRSACGAGASHRGYAKPSQTCQLGFAQLAL